MPLKKSCSLEDFRWNVAAEIRAGREPQQAAAIAHRTLREACREAGQPTPRTDSALAELEITLEQVQRYDFTPLGKAERTPQGFVRFPANLTRTGVLTYRKADGTVQRELRHPDEVFDAESLETLRTLPVTDLHSAMVNPGNVRQLQMGVVGESVGRADPYAKGTVTVMDEAMIGMVLNGERKEGSPGYTCWLDWTPGEYQGEKYDAIQRDIRYNHWALGPSGWGRQGSEVALRLDGGAAASLETGSGGGSSDPKAKETRTMKRVIKIDGIEFELDSDAAHQAVLRLIEKADADSVKAGEQLQQLQGRYDGVVKERDELKKKLDAAEDPAKIDRLVNERAELVASARKVLGEEKLDGKSNLEIKVAVLKKLDEKFDGSGKAEAYVDGLFDQAMKSAGDGGTEERSDGTAAGRSAAPTPGGKPRDGKGKDEDRYDSKAAQERMVARNRDAWKQGLGGEASK